MKVVKTDKGYVSGAVLGKPGQEVSVFRGIPFAAPPVGDLRWQPPQPATPWEGTRECTDFSCISPQLTIPGMSSEMPQSEDCLYLNVITPAKDPDEKLPVLVWMHGGGYTMGCGNDIIWNNYRLPLHGAVVVTLNHRLGPIGLLAHPLLTKEQDGASGNYLFMDLIASLEWIKTNIRGFGGDPDNVTIFGESGGGAKVSIMMASPQSKGLFHRAICESGTATAILKGQPLQTMEKHGEAFFSKLGVKTLAEARRVPFEKIIEVAQSMEPPRRPGERPTPVWDSTVDGQLIPDDPTELFASARINAVPLIVSANLGELVGPGLLVMPFIIPAYVDMLNAVTKQGHAGYAMIFDQVPSTWRAEGCNAVHSIELPYVFGDYDDTTGWWKSVWMIAQQSGAKTEDPGLTGTDKAISEAMMSLWTSFARDGNPKADSVPHWPAYGDADEYLYVNEKLDVRQGFSNIP